MSSLPSGATRLYVGTFSRHLPHARGRGEGIYVFELDPRTVSLTHRQTVDAVNPSFLALAPDHRHLYAVNAVPEIDGHPGGAVSAFAVDPTSGDLTLLNREAAQGAGPCHVSVDRDGQHALVASYHGGSAAVLPIQEDGRLGPATDVVEYSGAGPDPVHQQGPHAHSINLDPANRFALVCNQGLDTVFSYRFDAAHGRLRPNPARPAVRMRPRSGPRHLAFHPDGRFVYVINEQGASITAFAYDAANGALRELQTVPTIPDGFAGENACADVHVHPSGRFVYGSNRGHDSLAIFAVDQETGRLTPLGHQSTEGRTPRNITLDPAGAVLLAANQDSDTIVAFRVEPAGGRLVSLGPVARVPSPTCLQLA